MKISAQILARVADKLARKFQKSCMKRDEFLGQVLEVELNHLEIELPERNSERSRRFIRESLSDLFKSELGPRRPMSFQLPNHVVERMESICDSRGIIRDAFLNRLLFFLAVSPKSIDRIFFDGFEDWRNQVWSAGKHDGPFFDNVFYPLEQSVDPFWPIRYGLEFKAESNGGVLCNERDYFHSLILSHQISPKVNLYGLNSYLPDWAIPGSKNSEAADKSLDELLDISEPSDH